jgi:beta-lactamase regulating signal transducer with metallopeptidase domain
MTVLLAGLADAAIVLALGLAAAALMRRRSAALRHAILSAAVLAAAAMPALEWLLPQVPVIRWPLGASAISSGATLTSLQIEGPAGIESDAAAGAPMPWPWLIGIVWAAGAALMSAGLITGLVRLARLRSRCTPVAGRWRELADELGRACGLRQHVDVLQSDAPGLLITCGLFAPRIILPATASRWTDERKRVVLLHELAHIARRDAALQLAGEVVRALHWINPLVWMACRRLRQESEYACDDAVLRCGVEATEYATHLLDVARHLSGRRVRIVSAAAIAHPSTLERRITAMLNRQRNRAPLGRRGGFVAAVAALGLGLPLAAIGAAPAEPKIAGHLSASDPRLAPESRPDALDTMPSAPSTATPPATVPPIRNTPSRATPQTPVTIAGTVRDQTGAVLPGVQMTLADTQTQKQSVAHTDASGRYAFRGIPPAEYQLSAQLAAFATVAKLMTLGPGSTVDYSITLPLGTVQEQVTVLCSSGSPVDRIGQLTGAIVARLSPVLSAQEPQQIVRVGGNVKAPRKIRDVKPTCPAAAPEGETTIRLAGRIGQDGLTVDLRSVSATPAAEVHELVGAAIDAVREWRFTPTLLNNDPVEIDIAVEVVFKKS